MRNVLRIQVIALSIGLALAACARQPVDSTPAASTPERIGPAAPTQTIALQCTPPQRQCFRCNGTPFCGIRCPECAPQAQPAPGPSEIASLTCNPPLHDCTACNGAHFCSRQCPLCPPAASAEPELAPATLAFTPVPESCGGAVCRPGTSCCNPSCGICTPNGVNCTQQSCN